MWLKLYNDRLEWAHNKLSKSENSMQLDHTSTVTVKPPGVEFKTAVICVQTGGATGQIFVFGNKDSASISIWEAAVTGVINKLKTEKKLRPSVVLFKKVLRRNSYLGLSFDQSSVSEEQSRSIMQPEDLDGEPAIMEGYLQKRGHVRQSWTNRYFVLTSDRLTYFTDSSMKVTKGYVVLDSFAYVRPRDHVPNSHHRQLFSLHTTPQNSANTEEERHMLLMNGLNEDDVKSWCSMINKVILDHKITKHPHLTVCVSTYLTSLEERSLLGDAEEQFYDLKLLSSTGVVTCHGHAFFADMKNLQSATTSTSILSMKEMFPRSYKRKAFGVALSEELLETRRLKLENWLQDLVNCLTRVLGGSEMSDPAVRDIVRELGVHFNCDSKTMERILKAVPKPSGGLSKIFGSGKGDEPESDEDSLSENDREADEAKIANDDEDLINSVNMPEAPAELLKLNIMQLLQLCRQNNIDPTSFRNRNRCLQSLFEIYKKRLPYLHDKDAREEVESLVQAHNSTSKFTKTYGGAGSGNSEQQSDNYVANVNTIFNDTLLKLEVCPDIIRTLQSSYTTNDKLKMIKKTVQIWDVNVTFTAEDAQCVKCLLDLTVPPHPCLYVLVLHRLTNAIKDPDWMYLFCAKKGIQGIVMQLNRYMECFPISRSAAVSVIDLLKCVRLLADSRRLELIHTKTIFFATMQTLQCFDHVNIVIECLEFLLECIVCGGAVALGQIKCGFEYLANSRNEATYEILLRILTIDNVALQCSALSFINSIILYEKSTKSRVRIHSAINLLGFEKICGAICSGDVDNMAASAKIAEDILNQHTRPDESKPEEDVSLVKGETKNDDDITLNSDNGFNDSDKDDDSSVDEASYRNHLRPGVLYHESLGSENTCSDDGSTAIHPEKGNHNVKYYKSTDLTVLLGAGIMASYAQELLKESNFQSSTGSSMLTSRTGGTLASKVRRLTINILEDMTSSYASNNSSKPSCKLIEVTKWLRLSDDVLIIRQISSKRIGNESNDQVVRIQVNQIIDVLDYADFDSADAPFSVQGCITLVLSEKRKYFFHFGEDRDTKLRWLIALNSSIENASFHKKIFSTSPNSEVPLTSRSKYKKKFEKYFQFYRSIRDEDAILVFNESIVPYAEASNTPSMQETVLNPTELTQYMQYEFHRRKDLRLQLLLKELSQYFVKNYPPRLPENESKESAEKISHPLAVMDSTNPIPQAPPLPALPPEKNVNKANVKMKQIFWNKIKPVNVRGTMWMSVEEPDGIQWLSLEERFGEKEAVRRRAIIKKSQSNSDSQEKLINLFDNNRTQNVAIACAKLKKTPQEIYQNVLEMDPVDLSLEVTDIILHLLLPSNEEIATLRAFTGDVNKLDYCGQLFSYFTQIEGLQNRLTVQKIMLSWMDEANLVLTLLGDVKQALIELRSEQTLQPLKDIMATVLAVGNYMNGNNRSGKAHGFKLDTLLKIKDIREKQHPQKNLLHFVLEQFPTTADSIFYGHWETVWKVPKISKSNVECMIKQLQESLETCIAAIATAEDIQNVDIRENLMKRLSELTSNVYII